MVWLVYRYQLQREASHFSVAGHIFLTTSTTTHTTGIADES